jgi:hypothetical protein
MHGAQGPGRAGARSSALSSSRERTSASETYLVEQREAHAARGVGQRVVEQFVEQGDAGAATNQHNMLEFDRYV